MSTIGVVGAGYVGLTAAACFARLGHDVVCADLDEDKVRDLARGRVPILEEDLTELVAEGLAAGRLRFVVGATEAARGADFVFLAVATPRSEDGSADLSHLEAAAREIAPVLGPVAVVVNKSTSPVGSTALLTRVLREAGAGPGVGVAANPEFLREGMAVRDFLEPSRIVVGADDPGVAARVCGLYERVDAPIVVTSAPSAELIKYASNAFLATKISFVNAVANLCEAVGADIHEVTSGMGHDPRIGSEFLHAGPGWGGSCLPKDTSALLSAARAVGYDFSLLRGAVETNDEQRERIVAKIRRACGGDLTDKRVAALGLTFKADTDDRRESPAIAIAGELLAGGARVCAFDPTVPATTPDLPEGLSVASDPYEACRGADVLVVLTEWGEFRELDFARIAADLGSRHVVDARNLLDPATLRRLGLVYEGVGR